MHDESTNLLWLDSSQRISFDELVVISGLTVSEIKTLVDSGALIPIDMGNREWIFSAESVTTVRQAARLRDDLELDHHALALTLTLLEKVRLLEADLAHVRAQLPVLSRF